MVQWLGVHALTAKDVSSILARGTEIQQTKQPTEQNKNATLENYWGDVQIQDLEREPPVCMTGVDINW